MLNDVFMNERCLWGEQNSTIKCLYVSVHCPETSKMNKLILACSCCPCIIGNNNLRTKRHTARPLWFHSVLGRAEASDTRQKQASRGRTLLDQPEGFGFNPRPLQPHRKKNHLTPQLLLMLHHQSVNEERFEYLEGRKKNDTSESPFTIEARHMPLWNQSFCPPSVSRLQFFFSCVITTSPFCWCCFSDKSLWTEVWSRNVSAKNQ